MNIAFSGQADNSLLKTLTKTFQFKNETDTTNTPDNRDVHLAEMNKPQI